MIQVWKVRVTGRPARGRINKSRVKLSSQRPVITYNLLTFALSFQLWSSFPGQGPHLWLPCIFPASSYIVPWPGLTPLTAVSIPYLGLLINDLVSFLSFLLFPHITFRFGARQSCSPEPSIVIEKKKGKRRKTKKRKREKKGKRKEKDEKRKLWTNISYKHRCNNP